MHGGLLDVARRLASDDGAGFADRRVAISAAYYALFNKLAAYCADALIGAPGEARPERAWEEAYRNLSHSSVARDCRACVEGSGPDFPKGIVIFARCFSPAMRLRHRADYDPFFEPTRSETLAHIAAIRAAMREIELVRTPDRRAFASYLHFGMGRKNIRQGQS